MLRDILSRKSVGRLVLFHRTFYLLLSARRKYTCIRYIIYRIYYVSFFTSNIFVYKKFSSNNDVSFSN